MSHNITSIIIGGAISSGITAAAWAWRTRKERYPGWFNAEGLPVFMLSFMLIAGYLLWR